MHNLQTKFVDARLKYGGTNTCPCTSAMVNIHGNTNNKNII